MGGFGVEKDPLPKNRKTLKSNKKWKIVKLFSKVNKGLNNSRDGIKNWNCFNIISVVYN
jgi:hypothetical protein